MQMALEGLPGPVPPLWRVALFGEVPHESMQLAPATTGPKAGELAEAAGGPGLPG
jgi:hypothetical protein